MSESKSDQTAPPPPRRPAPATDETIKETFESIIIAFILAFVFRAYVVEAFVIPTGSMAPMLLGAHADIQCDQCGYEFATEWPSKVNATSTSAVPVPTKQDYRADCPMCRYPNRVPRGATHRSGDRILVQKYLYTFTDPQRWDVVVFKAPHSPETNYIKRLIGLPGEGLLLFEGNVYAKQGDAPWAIQRKSDRENVQRAVWQPIYDSRYIPLDEGRAGEGRKHLEWSVPWVAQGAASDWQIKGQRSYRYDSAAPGGIRFDFDRADYDGKRATFAYNQAPVVPRSYPIEDVRLDLLVRPETQGLTLALSTTARLDRLDVKSPERLTFRIDGDGTAALLRQAEEDAEPTTLATAEVGPLPPGENTRVELWYVDQQVIGWVNGEAVVSWAYDLSIDDLKARRAPEPKPKVTVNVSGSPVSLHRVKLDRDLYYAEVNANAIARSAVSREPGNRFAGEPITLTPNEFFCLGDNSPMSLDSRYWDTVNPWILERYFGGIDEAAAAGRVPREMMIGRAFFVYLPSPYYPMPKFPVPNFGEMRFIH